MLDVARSRARAGLDAGDSWMAAKKMRHGRDIGAIGMNTLQRLFKLRVS
jgi:hypothetical protein